MAKTTKDKTGSKVCGAIAFFIGIGLLCLTVGVIVTALLIEPEVLSQFAEAISPREEGIGYAIGIFLIIIMALIGGGVTAYGQSLLSGS